MTLNRRHVLALTSASLLAALSRPVLAADQTAELQAAIEQAQNGAGVVILQAGTYAVTTLTITTTVRIQGVPGKTILTSLTGAPIFNVTDAAEVSFFGLVFDSKSLVPEGEAGGAGGTSDKNAKFQLYAKQCSDILIENCIFQNAATSALGLDACTGRVIGNRIHHIAQAAILAGRFYGQYQSLADGDKAPPSRGLEISSNHVHDIGNNGIMLKHFTDTSEEDGSIISNNHVERVHSGSGNGQHGNGIYVLGADNVIISGNRITDTDFSGIRDTSSKHIQIVNNSISRSSEVSLFVEFAFESALVNANIIEDAFRGIELSGGDGIVGFNGVCSNNIVRNVTRATVNPDGGKFIGINITANNTIAIGNLVENVGSNDRGGGIGLLIQDWRKSHSHSAQGNMIKNVPYGIGIVLGDGGGGLASAVSVSNNTIATVGKTYVQLFDPKLNPVGGDQTENNTLPNLLTLSNNTKLN